MLHTHSRRLDFHPHVHLVMPAAALDAAERLWRTKTGKGKKPYLFNHKALAKVFRAKMLDAIRQEGLEPPSGLPEAWVVDVKSVGKGDKALVYLGRYLYKGVIQEKDIVACENGKVTFRYRNAKTKRMETRTVSGAKFLWLILRHVLPKGFRRARNFGFLHPVTLQAQWHRFRLAVARSVTRAFAKYLATMPNIATSWAPLFSTASECGWIYGSRG